MEVKVFKVNIYKLIWVCGGLLQENFNLQKLWDHILGCFTVTEERGFLKPLETPRYVPEVFT